jgi:hypothetical protein
VVYYIYEAHSLTTHLEKTPMASFTGEDPRTSPVLEPRPELLEKYSYAPPERRRDTYFFEVGLKVVTPQLMESITEEMRQEPFWDFEESFQKPHDRYLAKLFPDLEPSARVAAYYAAVERGDGYRD